MQQRYEIHYLDLEKYIRAMTIDFADNLSSSFL